MSMFRSALCGFAAGAVGTVAMDLVWFVRYKRSGGQSSFLAWETASGLDSWDAASAPAKVGKLLYETVSHRDGAVPPANELVSAMRTTGFRHVVLDETRRLVKFRVAGLELSGEIIYRQKGDVFGVFADERGDAQLGWAQVDEPRRDALGEARGRRSIGSGRFGQLAPS